MSVAPPPVRRRRVRAFTLAPLAAGGALLLGNPASAQMAVFDASSYAKLLQQAQTELSELQQLQQQLTQAEALYQSLNTASNIGSLATGLLSVPQVLSSNLQAFGNVGSGDFSSLGSAAPRAQAIRTQTQIYTPAATSNPAQTFTNQALATSGNRAAAAQAVSETAYAIANQRATGLAQLRDAIPTAADARAVLDLTARIAAESALIANDQMRLQALQMQERATAAESTQASAENVAASAQTRAALLQGMHP